MASVESILERLSEAVADRQGAAPDEFHTARAREVLWARRLVEAVEELDDVPELDAEAEAEILAALENDETLTEVSSRVYPSLERKPGKQNWVDKAGGLPSYIERIAKHLHYEKGKSISHAIAIAVNTVKRWCKGGTVSSTKGPTKSQNVTAATKAKACAAVAQWNAKRAKGK